MGAETEGVSRARGRDRAEAGSSQARAERPPRVRGRRGQLTRDTQIIIL